MLIYTLQFPEITLKSRVKFLHFVQRNVIEFAFKHQVLFLEKGLTAEYFHRNAEIPKRKPQERIPIHIHSIVWNGIFSLRAYGEKAVATLQIWSQLFLDENPKYRHHIIEHIEHINIERLEQPMYYVSDNWIPFREMQVYKGFYVEAGTDYSHVENEKDQPHFALNKQLFNNLGTFLRSHNIEIHRDIELVQYPSEPQTHIALRTQKENIYKQAFHVKIKIHIRLPICFSLGQNTGYGNGVFKRIIPEKLIETS